MILVVGTFTAWQGHGWYTGVHPRRVNRLSRRSLQLEPHSTTPSLSSRHAALSRGENASFCLAAHYGRTPAHHDPVIGVHSSLKRWKCFFPNSDMFACPTLKMMGTIERVNIRCNHCFSDCEGVWMILKALQQGCAVMVMYRSYDSAFTSWQLHPAMPMMTGGYSYTCPILPSTIPICAWVIWDQTWNSQL